MTHRGPFQPLPFCETTCMYWQLRKKTFLRDTETSASDIQFSTRGHSYIFNEGKFLNNTGQVCIAWQVPYNSSCNTAGGKMQDRLHLVAHLSTLCIIWHPPLLDEHAQHVFSVSDVSGSRT